MPSRRQQPGQPRPEHLKPGPAPGELRLLQAFVNTRDLEEQRDEIDSPEALREWLTRQHLVAPAATIQEIEWRCAVAVREGLRSLLRSNNGVPVNDKAVDVMNRAFSLNRPHLRLERDHSVSLTPETTGWAEALARLLEIVLHALQSGSWTRLKACRNSRCRWVFFDNSRNRSGKWCTVRRCGNRIHSKKYRRGQSKISAAGSDLEDAMLASLDDWLRKEGH